MKRGPLTIGIDVAPWVNRRGFGRFTREVVSALVRADGENRYVLFADEASAAAPDLPGGAERVVVRTRAAQAEAASATGRRGAGDLLRLARAVRRVRPDLFFFPTHLTYFPILARIPVVVGIHDATPARHPGLIFPTRRSRFFWTMKERLALAQARAVVTVSEASRREIATVLRVPGDRIRVLPEGASACFRPRAIGADEARALSALGASVEEGYLLYVGGVSPHKNLDRLVAAFARVAREPRWARVRLVFAGDVERDPFHSSRDTVRAAIARAGLEERVAFAGFVPDDTLALLYSGATALVFPSLAEGFGLPPIEAMACGTPVVASRAGSLPEVLGDAALLVDPQSEESLAAAIRAVLGDADLRARLRERGLARSRLFSWERAAEILAALFREVAR